ncbi:MAG: hypothetical protein FJ029_06620 [Actinobacteria bacterium]|nr:hypothetical protein [Actinomycetota bacterium]
MELLRLIPPQVVLGLVLATTMSFLFHGMVGRRHRSGIFYWPFGVLFFTAGALLATPLGAHYLMLGGLPVLAGMVGCLLGLILAHVLLA